MLQLMTLKEASLWASNRLKKNVTKSNISYLIQYGKIRKYNEGGVITVSKNDLLDYYQKSGDSREQNWKRKLGDDLNWNLSFEQFKERDTTKHIHRLHPYKGKFIPQLVEYFIDDHTDAFKKEVYFHQGDIILDPFAGSGTTLVQANEQGMHAVGIDISAFNALIANVKIIQPDFQDIYDEVGRITDNLKAFIKKHNNAEFENALLEELNVFNKEYFPSPQFKVNVARGEIDEQEYGAAKAKQFLPIYNRLKKKYRIKVLQDKSDTFLEKWYLAPIRKEIDLPFNQLKDIEDPTTKRVLTVVLSRTIRSCRATTHANLATLKEPATTTYYCKKHKKICKPLFSMLSWWERYSMDTLRRLCDFDQLRTDTHQVCLQGDARSIDIFSQLTKQDAYFGKLVKKQKIRGIFSSPPYIGLIDYHEQHAYAYDLFGFERNDKSEIGPLFKGQGRAARESYIEGIASVLNNSKRFLQDDYDIFLVANDKYRIYPTIASEAGLQIVNQYKRPVLNRTEKDKSAYAETIFHLKAM